MGPHYVYEHWRPDLNLPYYIGKGQRGRAWDMQARNAYHKRVTNRLAQDGLRPVIKLVSHHPTDAEALAHEVARIAYWRRQGVRLTNLTAGGESGIRRGLRRRRRPQLVPLVLLRQPGQEILGRERAMLCTASAIRELGSTSSEGAR